jgi:Flp pilus assembly protein TadD
MKPSWGSAARSGAPAGIVMPRRLSEELWSCSPPPSPRTTSSAASTPNLGLTQLWTGRSAEAVASLETASRAAPNNYMIWGNLGDAYRAARAPRGKADEAFTRSIKLARAQLRLNPQDATAHSFLATSLAKTGHVAEAAAPMREALALEEKNPNMLSDAAIVAALSGRTDEALSWLRKAVDAGYCRAIIARQPEFEALRNRREFQEVIERATPGPALRRH